MKKRAMLLTTILLSVALCSSACSAQKINWFTSFEKAQKHAKNEAKKMLLLFSDPEDCYACTMLEKNVFQKKEWAKIASETFVHVRFSFSNLKKKPVAVQQYIRKIQARFMVDYIPQIILIDTKGNIYGIADYKSKKNTPSKYFVYLNSFNKQSQIINQLIKKVRLKKGAEKTAVIKQLLQATRKWQVDYGYNKHKETIVKLDKSNKYKEQEKASSELYEYYARQKNTKKAQHYLNILRKVNQNLANTLEARTITRRLERGLFAKYKWKKAQTLLRKYLQRFTTGESAQLIHYYIGKTQYQLQDKKAAIRSFTKAIAFAPNTKLAKKIARWLKVLR